MTKINLNPQKEGRPAGDFSDWLQKARQALYHNTGTDVDCGECVGCCSSAYFIAIEPDESATLKYLNPDVLADAPGLPKGNRLIPYDEEGKCPLLKSQKCTIYAHRPRTCRNYDCRVFAASGIAAGGEEKRLINDRVKQWEFNYPQDKDRQEHEAVLAAAIFIRENAKSFPQGRIPASPSQLAILAIKVYSVFLDPRFQHKQKLTAEKAMEIANAIVKANQNFGTQKPKINGASSKA